MSETGRSAGSAFPSGDGSYGEGRSGADDRRDRSQRPSSSLLASPPSKCVKRLVVERMALIHHIQDVFPPAPDAKVLYGNQFLDLWACGQPLEEPWAETWRRLPLVLHDVDLAEAVQTILPAKEDEGLRDDFTNIITKVLNTHPGPIQCLRVDCTACPGADLLRSWVGTLSAKGVQELVLLNLTEELQPDFPLSCLRSRSLTTLGLGFFRLPEFGIDWFEHAPALQSLNITGCTFLGRDLSSAVCRLPNLSSLTLGCCDITLGCDRHGLRIDSQKLVKLHFWNCTANTPITINAPTLVVLITGLAWPLTPTRAAPALIRVPIELTSIRALEEIHDLTLHGHILCLRSDTAVKFNGQWIPAVPSMDTLNVGVHVCNPSYASVLVSILSRMPLLKELTLQRLDDLTIKGDDEDCIKAWSLQLVPPCIRDSLEHFAIGAYRGGCGEVALLRRVMSVARRLLTVTVYPHHTVPLETAADPIRGWPVASKNCTIVVGLDESFSFDIPQ